MGFDAVFTGHYARIVDGPRGPELHRAVDMAKDQSYVLAVLDAISWRTRCSQWEGPSSRTSEDHRHTRV
jgi:tRNA U34 2-thiouridine synthase MnmA/TrmU